MEIVQVTLLGGVLALDATAVGQFMLSRPLIAGALSGWILGDPQLGLLIGAVLELYLLVSFPTGGSRFPEGPTATVVAVASAVVAGGLPALPLAIAVGLIWGQLGGASITALRHVNSALVPEPGEPLANPSRVVLTHVAAVALDFLRAAVVTLSGVLVGRLVVQALVARWTLAAPASLGLVLVGGCVSVGVLLSDLGGLRRRRLVFVVGAVLGVLGARFL